jgi:uncharacterized membrane protein
VFEFLIVVLAVVWLVDRSRLRDRLSTLESKVERLSRSSARQQAERRSDESAPAAAPLSPQVVTLSTPESISRTPATDAERVDVMRRRAAAISAAALALAKEPPSAPDQGTGFETTRREAPAAREERSARPKSDRPTSPDFEFPGVEYIRNYFTGGNLIVRIGVVILFFGVAFLLRYLAEHSHLSIEMRLSGVAAGAIVLLGLGWHWRTLRRGYGLALQGGGVGILYLTTFTAQRIYLVLEPALAFVLLAAIAVLSAALAVLQDSMAFAMLGVTGGYLAPVLAAKPHGDHVALFGYFAILNGFALIVAWFRSWRPLNLLAFVFTYGIGTAWGVLSYRPENFATTGPFVALFFLMFVAIAVLYALRRGADLRHYVDGTLVFGTPVVTIGLQAGLVRHIPYGLAYSALTLSAFYLLLAWTLFRRRRETLRLLVETFLALGVAFATLAIPFVLEGRWTAASWALEGAAIVWVGLRQDRRLAIASGLALQALAAVSYAAHATEGSAAGQEILFLNAHYLAAILVSLGSLAIAAMLRRAGPPWLEQWRPTLGAALLAWGLLWWLGAGHLDIWSHAAKYGPLAIEVAYFGITALLATVLGTRLEWTSARFVATLLPLALACFAAERAITRSHPLVSGGWWAWPLALAIAYFALRRTESFVPAWLRSASHALACWVLVWALTGESAWQVSRLVEESSTWSQALFGVVPAAALIVILKQASGTRWPMADRELNYVPLAGGGLTAYLVLWSLYADLMSDGAAAPLPYIPLLNPMDIAQALGLLALVTHSRSVTRYFGDALSDDWKRTLIGGLAVLGFAWLNVVLLRTLHEYANVPYTLGGVAASTLAQTALTIFWTTLALVGMAWASRSARRLVWLGGATLLGVVILKLFLVDLSRTGTVLRIVSFLGVGILMLIIGYLSPIPPRRSEAAT